MSKKDIVDDKDVVENIDNDENVLVDLFRNEEIKDEFVNNMMLEKSDIIEEKLPLINSIILECNDVVNECATVMLVDGIDRTTYMNYMTKFCELRLKATKLRLNEDKDFNEDIFIIESGNLFNYYLDMYRNAFKESVIKEMNRNK